VSDQRRFGESGDRAAPGSRAGLDAVLLAAAIPPGRARGPGLGSGVTRQASATVRIKVCSVTGVKLTKAR
jgi:hypothetical protein